MLGNLNVTEANLCDDILILKLKGSREPTGKILNYIGKKLAGKKDAILKVDEYHPKRSLDANAYLWVLCGKIAELVGNTKEEVYQKCVEEAGQYEIVPIKREDIKKYKRMWESQGLGYMTEVLGECRKQGFEGYMDVMRYYGSSTYDSKQMAILVDNVVQECGNLGIETMPPNELKSLCEAWGR